MHALRYLRALPVVGLCLAMALACFEAAAQSPFTNSVVYTWQDNDNSDLDYVIRDQGATFAEYANLPAQYGKARAGYGVNGAQTIAVGAGNDGVSAQSTWSDGFIVTGGSGSLTLSVRLSGATAGDLTGFMYGLYVSSTPFGVSANAAPGDLIYNGIDVDQTLFGVAPLLWVRDDDVDDNFETGPINEVFTATVDYTSGDTFYVTSLLDVSAWESGSTDFWGSADFGISVSAGATLETLSGFTYAAAVPEPETYALMLAGLGLLGFAARCRKGGSTA